MKIKYWLMSLVVGTCMLSAAPASAAGKELAILVVGKTSDAELAARERSVVAQLTRARTAQGWNHKVLPIYSYHFDKSAERSYCEERLKVKASDLVVVGVVELEGGVPTIFVHRENVVRSNDVAGAMIDKARSEMASRGTLPATKPVATGTPKPPVAKPADKPVVAAPPADKPVTVAKPVERPAVVTKPVETPVVVVKPAEKPVVVTKPVDKPVVVTEPADKPVVVTKPVDKPQVAVVPSDKPVDEPTQSNVDRWSVQLGLFSSLDKARTLADKVKTGNTDVEIRKVAKDNAVMYRVLIGTYNSQVEAYNRAKELKEAGLKAFSVRLDHTLGTVVP
jgi:cell division septation protein DedD